MEENYDIFISYRRLDEQGNISGRDQARLIAKQLELEGYHPFFDYSEIKDNEFDKVIIPAVENSKVFILVLTKDALNRCKNEDDWVRKEIETAIVSDCKIINVTPDNSFNGWPPNLPKSIEKIKMINISDVHFGQLFEVSMKKLIDDRISHAVGKLDVCNTLSIEDAYVLGFEMTIYTVHKLRNQETEVEERMILDKMTQYGIDEKLYLKEISANNMIEQIDKCAVLLGKSYGKSVENALCLGALYAITILFRKIGGDVAHSYDEGIRIACLRLGIAESIINKIIHSSAESLEEMYGLMITIIKNLQNTTERCNICGSPIAKDYFECPICHSKQNWSNEQ